MITANKHVGTHADQHRAGLMIAYHEAGIGRFYADMSLADCGPVGESLKAWMLDNQTRLTKDGFGLDIRGSGKAALDLVNCTGRAFLMMRMGVRIMPLIRLFKALTDAENREALRHLPVLIVRDFETPHENPLRAFEVAEIEAFLEDRMTDGRNVCVWRHGREPAGWWSPTVEDLLQAHTRTVEVA